MLAVYRYELKRYLVTPIGYVFMGAFLLMSGLLFFFYNLTYYSNDMISLYSDMTSFLMFLIPVLTMRSFAEERKNRSDQFLFTAPVSVHGIVMGKMLAAVTVYLITLLFTLVDVAIIGRYGTVYWGEIAVGYLGFFLLSTCYISSGLMLSALCENQLSAAVLTFGVHFLFSAVDWIVQAVPSRLVKAVLEGASLYTRFKDVQRGVLSLNSCVYFCSVTMLFLYLTTLILRARRRSRK